MFVDTSGWLCVLDERDRRHSVAQKYFNESRELITHSYVIAELVPLAMRRGFSRRRTLEFITVLLDDPSIEIEWVDKGRTRSANDLLISRSDKDWSLCDAISFVLMEELRIIESLTTDHHFEQAGFIKLLES